MGREGTSSDKLGWAGLAALGQLLPWPGKPKPENRLSQGGSFPPPVSLPLPPSPPQGREALGLSGKKRAWQMSEQASRWVGKRVEREPKRVEPSQLYLPTQPLIGPPFLSQATSAWAALVLLGPEQEAGERERLEDGELLSQCTTGPGRN